MTHDGDSNFAIELLDNAGNTADLLVNEIGAFGGIKAIGVRNGNLIVGAFKNQYRNLLYIFLFDLDKMMIFLVRSQVFTS